MLINCAKCGKLFTQRGTIKVCPDCVQEKEEVFGEVKTYLGENKSASFVEVVEALDVDPVLVVELIEESRLYFVDNPNFGIECARCGQPTNAGRYCPKCSREMEQVFSSTMLKHKEKKQDNGKGYFSL